MSVTSDIVASGSTAPEAEAPEPPLHWQEAIDQLRQCLRSELVALEGYDRALQYTTNPRVSQRLLELRGDHARRKDLIRSRIERRGTAFAESSERQVPPSRPLDDEASVAALQALERRGMSLYRDGVVLDEPSTRAFFETVLLPAQQRTHDLCRALEKITRGDR